MMVRDQLRMDHVIDQMQSRVMIHDWSAGIECVCDWMAG
jgi:hypothetical protein